MRNNEEEKEDEEYERMDNQDTLPIAVASIRVPNEARSTTVLPPTHVTGVTPATAQLGRVNLGFASLSAADRGRNDNNTTIYINQVYFCSSSQVSKVDEFSLFYSQPIKNYFAS